MHLDQGDGVEILGGILHISYLHKPEATSLKNNIHP